MRLICTNAKIEMSVFYFLDIQFGGVEVVLYFLCVLCGFFSFCPLLGKALLSLPDMNNQTHTLIYTVLTIKSQGTETFR